MSPSFDPSRSGPNRPQVGAAALLLLLGVLLVAAVGGVVLLLSRSPATPAGGGGADVVTLATPEERSDEELERVQPRADAERESLASALAPADDVAASPGGADPSHPKDHPVADPRVAGGERRERLFRLRRTSDPAVRLETARLVLAEGPEASLLSMALETLAELAPESVMGELRGLVSQAGVDGPGTQALAASIRSLGAGGGVLSDSDLALLYPEGAGAVQVAVALTLSERGDDRLVRELELNRTVDLQNGSGSVRAAAVTDLAALGSGAHVGTVTPLLQDNDPVVRLAVLDALRMADDTSVLEQVRPLVDDPERRVRMKAQRIVQRLENQLRAFGASDDGR